MDKITFEDLPSETTPVRALKLNEMQANIEKSTVYVGSTTPSTGEKVWIKKGKNLFNKNSVLQGYSFNGASIVSNPDYAISDWIYVKDYEKVYISGSSVTISINAYDDNKEYVTTIFSSTNVVTISSGTAYIKLVCKIDDLNTIQIIQGSTSATYESYVNKEILIKNDNNKFEQFYREPINDSNSAWQTIDTATKYKVIGNIVYIYRKGTYTPSSPLPNNDVVLLFTIPIDIRPHDKMKFSPVLEASNFNLVQSSLIIYTNGNVYIEQSSGSSLTPSSLDFCISYPIG